MLSQWGQQQLDEFEIVCVHRAVKIHKNAIEHFSSSLDATFTRFNYSCYRKLCALFHLYLQIAGWLFQIKLYLGNFCNFWLEPNKKIFDAAMIERLFWIIFHCNLGKSAVFSQKKIFLLQIVTFCSLIANINHRRTFQQQKTHDLAAKQRRQKSSKGQKFRDFYFFKASALSLDFFLCHLFFTWRESIYVHSETSNSFFLLPWENRFISLTAGNFQNWRTFFMVS